METEVGTHGRFKGAPWYSSIKNTDAIVIGAGGIGSHLCFQLARSGVRTIAVYDFDQVEEHNLSGQLFKHSHIGYKKVAAVENIINEFAKHTSVVTFEKYTEDSMIDLIMFMALDNLETRKIAFRKWKEAYSGKPEAIFIDGRLSMNVIHIFSILGTDLQAQKAYEEVHLPDDSTIEDEECTTKQTTFCAAMIASHMVGIFTNFLTPDRLPNSIPFFMEFIIPMSFYTVGVPEIPKVVEAVEATETEESTETVELPVNT